MKELSLITHLGLGDLILLSGLAVHFSEQYDRVYVHCRKKDYNSVYSFFLLTPKVQVVPLDVDSTTPENIQVPGNAIATGFYGSPMDRSISFAENFYRQAGVDYSVRWDKCPIQEVMNRFYDADWSYSERYRFVHHDPERGFIIPPTQIPTIVSTPNRSSILSYCSVMREATYVEVIDGPFLHLAESIETFGELFYHKHARPLSARWNDIDCPTRKKWNVLT